MDQITEFLKLLTAIFALIGTVIKILPKERRRPRPRKGRARKRKR